jgi:hypothetical protein
MYVEMTAAFWSAAALCRFCQPIQLLIPRLIFSPN